MPTISWNLIQDRATEFVSKWASETYEKGESQSFWSDFLNVYGIDRKRHGAFFEYAVKKTGGKHGFIDMFWPGKLLAEQKSAGRDLTMADLQALDYLQTMADHDLPQAIVVSDFANFQLRMLGSNELTQFTLEDFPKHVKAFAFLIEQQSRQYAEEDPVNRKAAEAMAALHNSLRDDNYAGHDLELLLVRLVFCMFADDSGIFERSIFEKYIYERTNIDGSDLGPRLVKIFEVLNTPVEQRQGSLDEDLKALRYINGGLFSEPIRTPDFTYQMRDDLLKAMNLDWSQVSPAIFGSMFQGVMDAKQRRNLGAHYTSEKNILRVIKPLFLDELYEEFARIHRSPSRLRDFHAKLASLTFLDPACGCGNFLVITYRELRRLEHKVIEALHGKNVGMFDVGEHNDVKGLVRVNVDQMYGIELEEFPALIAQTALWLTDHQMNREFSKQTGETFVRLPLTTSATIVNANALTTDWTNVIEPQKLYYILGNPPYNGSKTMTATMRADLAAQFNGHQNIGVLDFVSAWYAKSAQMMQQNSAIEAALVSTNSVTQGEQVGILWKYLLGQEVHINFAHRTFKWANDARGVAGVHCVIIGFGLINKKPKRLFEYTSPSGDPTENTASNINPYLVDAPDVLIFSHPSPISDVPKIGIGNKPIDGGNYLFTPAEKDAFLQKEPAAAKYFRRWIGSYEFINKVERWCLWLGDASPTDLRQMPEVLKRIEAVRELRLASKSIPTQALASRPTHFHVENIPASRFIAIPKVSSERRTYIPLGFLEPTILVSDLMFIFPDASLYHFGILSSAIHMAWVRAICGRLESRYRYSKDIVYNNFPWPEQVSDRQKAEIEHLAQAVLDARALFPAATLADLYDPLTMPSELSKAHQNLDRAVDKLYQPKPFATDAARVALLFQKYRDFTS